jgi:toxin secretion/phage lysis holin
MKESMVTGIGSASLAYLVGGWHPIFNVLIFFMALDYFTGISCAFKFKEYTSYRSFWGFTRKILALFIVIGAAQLDIFASAMAKEMGSAWDTNGALMFGTAIAFLYDEIHSAAANSARLGIKWPQVIMMWLGKEIESKVSRGDKHVPR